MSPAADPRPLVLLVDDEADILVALEDLLEPHYRIHATTSPAAALDWLASAPDVSVILSDQRMPEMPGHVFLGRARALATAEALLLTGYADLDAVVSAINDGRIAGYVAKPWEPPALLAMVDAAADRVRLRRALAFEQAVFAGLVERGGDAVSVLDAAGRSVRGPAPRRGGLDPDDRAALDAGLPSEHEERELGQNGTARWLRITRIPFTVDGLGAHLLRIEHDESARRQLEARLHQAEKLQAVGTLAGGIAHDFNNLLAAVLGNLELAARRSTEPRVTQLVGHAAEAARRGSTLTQRLLSFSRQRDLTATVVDPNDLVRGAEPLLSQAAPGGALLRFDLAPGAWAVRVDADQLELALLNLCINARDAIAGGSGGGGGEIVVGCANRSIAAGDVAGVAPGDFLALSVRDTGPGMPPEIAARVFEPFFTTKPAGRGTGLGLAMVHTLAEAAGGTATVETAPGHGTTVTIWLPRVEAETRRGDPSRGPLAVLLVEDEPDVRAMAASQLEELGHKVTAKAGGADAMAALRAGAAVDVLVTDYTMPGMSGADIAREAQALRPGLPVLLITGFADISALPLEATILKKPFTRERLAAAIERAFARTPAAAPVSTA